MMPYSIEFQAGASREFNRLDTAAARLVQNKLDELASDVDSMRHIALTGPLRGLFRLRAGDYRALYTIDRENRRIIVHAVKHRSEVYR